MKQKELKKKINEFMTMLNDNGYSSHVIVAKNGELESVGASGDLGDVINAFAEMFADAMEEDAPKELKVTCSAIADIVRQYQQIAIDSLLGLDDGCEECAQCDRLNECMNPSAVEKRKEMGLKIGNLSAN